MPVTSRKGRVSRNKSNGYSVKVGDNFTSRKGRVSRNVEVQNVVDTVFGHVPQGACE